MVDSEDEDQEWTEADTQGIIVTNMNNANVDSNLWVSTHEIWSYLLSVYKQCYGQLLDRLLE